MSKSKRVSLTLLTVVCLGVVGFLAVRDSSSGTGNIADAGGGAASSSTAPLQWIRWGTEATKRAEEENKLILVDVYADWCGPCKMMDRTTYMNSSVLEELKRFVTVKVDADTDTEAARKFSPGTIPTTAILNAKGETLLTRVGYIGPETFLTLLKGAHTEIGNSSDGEELVAAGRKQLSTLKHQGQPAPELDVNDGTLGFSAGRRLKPKSGRFWPKSH